MRGVYRRGAVYWIRYRDPQGRQRRERVGRTRRVAERALAHRLAEVAAGRFGLGAASAGPTLREFVEATYTPQQLAHLAPSTRQAYGWMLRVHVLPCLGDLHLRALSRAVVRAWIAGRMNGYRK
jgi:hypothetical protein